MDHKQHRGAKGKNNRRKMNNRSAMLKRLRRKRIIKLIITLTVFLAVVAGLTIGGIFIYKNATLEKIDLRDYTTLSYSGYDGKGNLYAELKSDGEFEEFFENVSVTISPNENLSNGDEVQLTYTYDKDIAKKLKLWVSGTEKTVDVHGLPENYFRMPM